MRLYDDNNRNIVSRSPQSSGMFMYSPHAQKALGKSNDKKKSLSLSGQNLIFEEEPIEFNDLDSNIMNRNMIKFLPTDSLRLELQLERAEKKLKIIDEEIQASEWLEFDEDSKRDFLEKKKKQLSHDIDSYKSQYRELGIAYKLADIFSDIRERIIEWINKIISYIFSYPLVKAIFEEIPGYKEKQKLEKISLLQKTIYREINKSSKVDTKKLEYLFQKTEELGS